MASMNEQVSLWTVEGNDSSPAANAFSGIQGAHAGLVDGLPAHAGAGAGAGRVCNGASPYSSVMGVMGHPLQHHLHGGGSSDSSPSSHSGYPNAPPTQGFKKEGGGVEARPSTAVDEFDHGDGGGEQEQVKDHDVNRPSPSFAELAYMAIERTLERRCTAQGVYDWVSTAFPYYQATAPDSQWKSHIRNVRTPLRVIHLLPRKFSSLKWWVGPSTCCAPRRVAHAAQTRARLVVAVTLTLTFLLLTLRHQKRHLHRKSISPYARTLLPGCWRTDHDPPSIGNGRCTSAAMHRRCRLPFATLSRRWLTNKTRTSSCAYVPLSSSPPRSPSFDGYTFLSLRRRVFWLCLSFVGTTTILHCLQTASCPRLSICQCCASSFDGVKSYRGLRFPTPLFVSVRIRQRICI